MRDFPIAQVVLRYEGAGMAGPRFATDPDPLAGAVALEGLTLVFHRRSGTTHVLAPPAPQILEALATHEGDAEAILAWIGERYELQAEDARAAIAARLAELEAAGLVWRI